jgi:hypothetical protein
MDFGDIDEINHVLIHNASYPEIIQLCQTKKFFNTICQTTKFWKYLNERDFYGLVKFNTRKEYEALYHFFNKYTINIIKIGLNPNLLYVSISEMYNNIFKILVELVRENKNNDDIDDTLYYNQIIAYFGTINDPFRNLRGLVGDIHHYYRQIKRT